MEEELTPREQLTEKVKFLKEKYADAINDIALNYGKDVGVAYDMLISIPRALILGEEPLYSTDIDLDYDELKADYLDYLEICKKLI